MHTFTGVSVPASTSSIYIAISTVSASAKLVLLSDWHRENLHQHSLSDNEDSAVKHLQPFGSHELGSTLGHFVFTINFFLILSFVCMSKPHQTKDTPTAGKVPH